jgi:uncharacterized membrane protein
MTTTPDLELAVVRFPGTNAAEEAFAAARARAGADAPWVHQVGYVEHHHNGRLVLRGMFAGHYVDIDEEDHVSDRGAAEGFAVGALVGLLGGPPGLAVGMVLGAIIGSQLGPPTETELEPRELVDQLRAALPRSSSAIVIVGPARALDEMLAALGDGGGEVMRQTLTAEQATALEASLKDAPALWSGPSRA